MKVLLAPRRAWMWILLPATAGLGTLALWARSLNWPLSVDANGVIMRHRGRVPWKSIRKISVWRDYCDGTSRAVHPAEMATGKGLVAPTGDIHHRRICTIPVRALHDGDSVAETILAMFKESRRQGRADDASITERSLQTKMPAAVERLHIVHGDPKRPRASPQRSPVLQRETVEELRSRLAI
jgi:hypothetical protein